MYEKWMGRSDDCEKYWLGRLYVTVPGQQLTE